jgi:hypothetical protein
MKFEFVINLKSGKADWPDNSAECAGAGGSGFLGSHLVQRNGKTLIEIRNVGATACKKALTLAGSFFMSSGAPLSETWFAPVSMKKFIADFQA